MPWILRRLPFQHARDRDERPRLLPRFLPDACPRRRQIVAYVSVTPPHVTGWLPNYRTTPVVLDTGFTHAFQIYDSQLDWLGRSGYEFPESGYPVRHGHNEGELVTRRAKVWLLRNVPGTMEVDLAARPLELAPSTGVIVLPGRAPDHVRWPLLGLAALVEYNLRLSVCGMTGRADLWSPSWWWPPDWFPRSPPDGIRYDGPVGRADADPG